MHLHNLIAIALNLIGTTLTSARRIHPKRAEDAWDPATPKVVKKFVHETVAEVSLPSRESHEVKSLPFLDSDKFRTKQYAGHLPATTNDKQIFYWLFEAENANDSTPTIIWLNGGPGCSSMIGLFIENGPFKLLQENNKWSMEPNPNSWHKLGHILYVDQPVGTGLSYTAKGNYCKDDKEVNADFYAFLQNFLKVHATFFVDPIRNQMKNKLFFAGESHAGHYIPLFMTDILTNANANDIKINLGGAMIGNGWSDPFHQYSVSHVAYGKGIIDFGQWANLNILEDECKNLLNKGITNNNICYTLLDTIVEASNGKSKEPEICYYDARIFGNSERYPNGITEVEAYLGSKSGHVQNLVPPISNQVAQSVLNAIHATKALEAGQVFNECADPPYFALLHQEGLGVTDEIVQILQEGIPLLFFNGMEDFICNHVGNEIFLSKLPWEHANAFSTAERYAWSPSKGDPPAGYVKSHKNLTFIKIKDAGHMVPLDQPEISFEMIKSFLKNHGQGLSHREQGIPSLVDGESICAKHVPKNQAVKASANANRGRRYRKFNFGR